MKKAIIIFVSIIVLSAVVMLVIFGINKFKIKSANQQAANNNLPATTTPVPAVPTLSAAQIAQLTDANNLKVMVKKFTETYGSYSTDNHFENLEILKPLMTAAMVAYVNKIIADGTQSKDFFGVTTRVVTQAVETQTDKTAMVRVKTQRQETKIGTAPRLYYQDLLLSLVKSDNGWLVDQAKWQ